MLEPMEDQDIAPGRAIFSPRVEIVDAQVEHVYALVDQLRKKDEIEILRSGIKPRRALYRAFRNSLMCRTAFVDGEIAAMWGIGVAFRPGLSPLSDLGTPWLHTSVAIERIPLFFVRRAKAELAAMFALKRRLESWVDADYAAAIRFLRLLGFTVEKPAPIGANGALFCRFHKGFDS
jgi:hypothetical protein